MKHFAALLLLTAAAALSGLDIDLHKYRVRQGKYEFTKDGEEIASLPLRAEKTIEQTKKKKFFNIF